MEASHTGMPLGLMVINPEKPMDALDFLEEAHRIGFGGIQLCENLRFAEFSDTQLLEIRERAWKLGMFIEVGMNGLTQENLNKHLRIASLLSSPFLRIVPGTPALSLGEEPEAIRTRLVKILRDALPVCREQDVSIGIENHFDLSTRELVRIVEEVGDERVGLILDTTNGLGFIERPEETFSIMGSHIISLHLKDYTVQKVEAGYMMTGTPLGEGRLKVEEIVKGVLRSGKIFSIVMEMTIRRKEQQSMQEVVEWEQKAIEKSAAFLQQILKEYNRHKNRNKHKTLYTTMYWIDEEQRGKSQRVHNGI